MIAVIADTNSQRIAQQQFASWAQCAEWIDVYISQHGLTKACPDHMEHGQRTAWVAA
jgi:hypothetical protein